MSKEVRNLNSGVEQIPVTPGKTFSVWNSLGLIRSLPFIIRHSIFDIRYSFLIGFFLFLASRADAAPGMTAEQLLHAVHQKFLGMKIQTMTYVEDHTVSTTLAGGGQSGMMMLNSGNTAHYRMRYYYKAPNRHAYKAVSQRQKGFYPGNPNQENSIAMDAVWEQKVLAAYRPLLSKDQTYRGRPVYVFNLVPLPGAKETVPSTWYIDKKSLLILKYVALAKYPPDRKASTMCEIYYTQAQGRAVTSTASCSANISGLPYEIKRRIKYSDYKFNIPIPDSVFNLVEE